MKEDNNIKENCSCKNSSKAEQNHTVHILTLLFAIGSLGLGIYNYYNSGNITNYNYSNDGNSRNFESNSIAEVVDKVSDSVVSITTESRTQSWLGTKSNNKAAGTGFIISKDGYIMTNKHVVEGAKTVNVTLNNGKIYTDVEIIGTDPLNDSAILKVKNPENFKPVTLGDSKTIRAGQQVIVIGNALGEYSNSVTSGIISGTGRELVASDSTGSEYEKLSDMIQTDAAINGGNSGGPIVNAAGEVIGIATAYASSSQTVGFAIPLANVKGIIRNVLETGKFERAVLGVQYRPITPELAAKKKLPVSSGAYLSDDENSKSILAGSAAEAAGLKAGDIITEVNGVKIGKAGSLSTLVGEYKVGETIDLKVLRGDKEQLIKLTLKAYQN
jgi:peptidase Do